VPEAVRLADSDLWLVPESDDAGGPDRILPGFGNTMRDGLGVRAERGGVELAIVGGLVADPVLGVRCTSIGVAGGRIAAIGRAGNPDTMDGVEVVLDTSTAVVDATEEAVLNSMLQAPTVVGRSGNVSYGLPADEVVRLLRAHGRL